MNASGRPHLRVLGCQKNSKKSDEFSKFEMKRPLVFQNFSRFSKYYMMSEGDAKKEETSESGFLKVLMGVSSSKQMLFATRANAFAARKKRRS